MNTRNLINWSVGGWERILVRAIGSNVKTIKLQERRIIDGQRLAFTMNREARLPELERGREWE